MAEINWIKLRVDMFDDDKIKIIQSMPEGDAILVVWSRWQPSAWPLRPSRSST